MYYSERELILIVDAGEKIRIVFLTRIHDIDL